MENNITDKQLRNNLKKFREFLVASWDKISEIMYSHNWDKDPCFIDDWVEINWELLVGRELFGEEILLGRFRYYPKQGFKKIFLTSNHPKFILCCEVTDLNSWYDVIVSSDQCVGKVKQQVISDEEFPLIFSGFLTKLKDGSYGFYPSFDFVSLVSNKTGNIFRVPFDKVTFYLKEISGTSL